MFVRHPIDHGIALLASLEVGVGLHVGFSSYVVNTMELCKSRTNPNESLNKRWMDASTLVAMPSLPFRYRGQR